MNHLTAFQLLVELMYDGRSELFDELRHVEPLETARIIERLHEISGKDFGQDFEAWMDWYTNQTEIGTYDERENLRELYRFKLDTDRFTRT